MSKLDFSIEMITKSQASVILNPYHYLTNISKSFKSGYNFGLFQNKTLVGVAIFTGFPVPELAKGMLGLEKTQQDGLFELSRLCLEPIVQKTEHNLASWFLSRCIRKLRELTNVRVILSYADESFHNGTIYAAANFTYYGLSTPKKDFYFKNSDGSFVKHSRGKVRGIAGEWRNRTRKHRFAMVFDKSLTVKWLIQPWKRDIITGNE